MPLHPHDPLRPLRWLREDEADADAVMRRLMHEAARAVPGLSSDPSLTDPLVRLLLQSMSREYARLYRQLDDVVGRSYRRLVEQMLSFPRAPRPSSTVLRLRVRDRGLSVDEGLRVIGRKAISTPSGPQDTNLSFSPLGPMTVAGLGGCVVVLETPDGRAQRIGDLTDPFLGAAAAGPAWNLESGGELRVFIGVDVAPSDDLDELVLYIESADAVREAMVWSRWIAGHNGDVLVPAEHERLGSWHGVAGTEALRSRSDRGTPRSPHDRGLVHLDREYLESGRGQVPPTIERGIAAGHLASTPLRVWLQVELHDQEQPARFSALRVHPDCVVAWNIEEETSLVSGGIEPEQRIVLERDFESIYRIEEVRDTANAVVFESVEARGGFNAEYRYHLDMDPEQNAMLRLSARRNAARPRSLEVDLLHSMGSQANGLDPGSVSIIHDRNRCPGVDEAVNVAASAGGEESAGLPQHGEELRAALVTRGRAVTRHDFVRLAQQFDPARVAQVEVGRGVTRRETGVVTCVDVKVRAHEGALQTEPQRRAFEAELHDHLQERACAGTAVRVRVEIAAKEASAKRALR